MVVPEKACRRLQLMALLALSFANLTPSAGGQGQTTAVHSAPTPGSSYAAAPAAPLVPGTRGGYGKLPLNPGNAVARLEELRNLMPNSRPQDFQEAVGEYCDWLSDLADAHWKLAQSFAKAEATKPQADCERQMCLKFGGLKRQAMLLKAEFLIRQRRYPEALGPLVDIVTAEPRTETGRSAYKLLQDIGFSETVQPAAPKVEAPASVPLAKGSAGAH